MRAEALGLGWLRPATSRKPATAGHLGAVHADGDDDRYVYYLDSKDVWHRVRRIDVRFYEARSAGH